MMIVSIVALSRKAERSSHTNITYTNVSIDTRGISMSGQIHNLTGAALGDGCVARRSQCVKWVVDLRFCGAARPTTKSARNGVCGAFFYHGSEKQLTMNQMKLTTLDTRCVGSIDVYLLAINFIASVEGVFRLFSPPPVGDVHRGGIVLWLGFDCLPPPTP